jgi:hypothetical protein
MRGVSKTADSIKALLLAGLFCCAFAYAGEHAAGPVPEEAAPEAEFSDAPQPEAREDAYIGAAERKEATQAVDRQRLLWDDRIDQYEADRLSLSPYIENPDELYEELTKLVRVRMRQLSLILDDAGSRDDIANQQVETLAPIFPAMDPALLVLPDHVVSVREAHENLRQLYEQRIRLLEYVSGDLRSSILGTELYGMRELYFELEFIALELRYQLLRIPAVGEQVVKMATRAPLPLIWFVIELWLLIFIFRWWLRWFPETIQRMRTYLLAIRPRTSEIARRMRGLWYIERVKSPVEWWVFFQALISALGFLELNFVTAMVSIVVRWVFLSWFAVVVLDAFSARGAGGTAGERGRTRLNSLRLLAAWLLLLGLGLDLANTLAGPAALYRLIERLFEVLSLPVLIAQLGLWRNELFLRAQREDRDFMSVQEYESQKGIAKYIGALKLLGFLFATWLRRLFLRRLEYLDPGRSGLIVQQPAVPDLATGEPISRELRDQLLDSQLDYAGYARTPRLQLVERLKHGIGGAVVVVGERGIGKDRFITSVCEEAGVEYVEFDCFSGKAADVERDLAAKLGINGPLDNRETIAAAVSERNIRVFVARNLHMLVRPVVGGFVEIQRLSSLFDMFPPGLMRISSVDRYSWQYMKCALYEFAAAVEVLELAPWSEEQIAELISARCGELDIRVTMHNVRVPSQYLDASEESQRQRDFKGLCVMAASLAGGNPSIALRLFADCLRDSGKGIVIAELPANYDARSVEQTSLHVMLVLRVIAQAERISLDDIVDNLRYPQSVVENALNIGLENNWIGAKDGLYTLTWRCFRTITRVLARRNLLAGVRQVSL